MRVSSHNSIGRSFLFDLKPSPFFINQISSIKPLNICQISARKMDTFSNSSTLQRFTNKEFLVRAHEATLKGLCVGVDPSQYTYGFSVFRSVTCDIKSSPHTSLSSNNRVDIKTIMNSINQPMTGKFLLCRSICPAFKMVAVGTVVDDPDGELCVRLSLYNFINDLSSRSTLETHLPVGTVLAIKNPWFKTTADHGFTVRCDNPTDVVNLKISKMLIRSD